MRRALLRTVLIAAACLAGAVTASAADTRSGKYYSHGYSHERVPGFTPGYTSTRQVPIEDRAENRIIPMYGNLPACEDPAVLGEITSWFNSREQKFWGPLQVVSYDHVRPIAFRPWGADFIPRRFCTGHVALNDGSWHRVDFSVREKLGLFGTGWNVNWCVAGLDHSRSYAPNCQMARPGPER